MIFNNRNYWIKILPIKRNSKSSSIYLVIYNEKYNFNIYDKLDKENYEIFYEGTNSKTCFF